MASDAQHRQELSRVPQTSSLYATYGVEVNALSLRCLASSRIGTLFASLELEHRHESRI
jgi:hypothetical protein